MKTTAVHWEPEGAFDDLLRTVRGLSCDVTRMQVQDASAAGVRGLGTRGRGRGGRVWASGSGGTA